MDAVDMGLVKDIADNKFLLILLEEEQYMQKLQDMLKSVEKTGTKICYLCLSKPYTYVISDFKEKGIDTERFVFVDVLSSHYGPPPPVNNCIFLSSPHELEEIKKAVVNCIENRECSVVVFDTISTLLIYQQTDRIVKFTSSLVAEKKQENTKKLFIILKEDGAQEEDVSLLTKDLELFADKKIDMTAGKNIKMGGQ